MKNLVVLAFASGSLATLFEASGLLPRDTTQVACSDLGRKNCGVVCIEQSETCCPDQQGGCPVGSVCWLGDNGKYGCCPVGKTCQGPGGSDITTNTITGPGSTSTVTIPESTTDVVETTATEPTETETIPTTTGPIGTITPVPTTVAPNGTGSLPTTSSPPFTAGAPVNGLALSGVLGGLVAVIAAFL
ncbi:hypothetical protein VFPPC_13277 [Pochonia chlamydosporia 170]|uniref:GPI anchored serine-threonine rich protein n=1 Tax=Pochonia chlamydosporia 170 TaxID=1380566 RepID=A0A179FXF2_METCM|nr:hypothetical protein VFPPC_13277 [Pochonia chlamydosporia 170]OAQ69898.1 hypothetical protein VFPPC_13277 [Pochonia chlamydosporia 170]